MRTRGVALRRQRKTYPIVVSVQIWSVHGIGVASRRPRNLSVWPGAIMCTGLGEEKGRAPEFLEHVVMPDDTLVGICLKYKVRC